VPDFGLYCDLFFLQPIISYIKHRLNLSPATPQTAMVEFHIGLQLSKYYNLSFRNSLPHIARPNVFYAHALALIRKYKFTLEQLHKSSLHQLYHSVINKTIPHVNTYTSHIWRSVHNPILHNHMKSLNYRTIYRILPLSRKSQTPTLDPNHMCRFCTTHAENLEHTLFSCENIKPVWSFIHKTIEKTSTITFPDLSFYLVTHFHSSAATLSIEDYTIYLFSLARQKSGFIEMRLTKTRQFFLPKKS